MNNSLDPKRKALALLMLFALLAPFAAVFTYFVFNNTLAVIGVFVVVALFYFPTRIIVAKSEGK